MRLNSFLPPTLCLLACLVTGDAGAQLVEEVPEEIIGVGVDDKRGEQIPLDLKFLNDNGQAIALADLFNGERPMLLSLNYSSCPMLCRVQLDSLIRELRNMEWTLGQEYDLVSVSIDPLETPVQAKQTEQKYLNDYGRPGSGNGLHFLTGDDEDIQKLADAVGFRYKYVPERQEYAHTAALMVCSPEGMVSRYLYGVVYDPQTLRLSLVEAGEGKVGSPLDQILLFCFHYDETAGRYGPAARRLMAAGGAITVMALALGMVPYWRRRSATASIGSPPGESPASLSKDSPNTQAT